MRWGVEGPFFAIIPRKCGFMAVKNEDMGCGGWFWLERGVKRYDKYRDLIKYHPECLPINLNVCDKGRVHI